MVYRGFLIYSVNILLLCRLEAEIKEAQLRVKEEMIQGIQIAKEMARQELSSQKAAYENKIKALEAELVKGRTGFLFLCRCTPSNVLAVKSIVSLDIKD